MGRIGRDWKWQATTIQHQAIEVSRLQGSVPLGVTGYRKGSWGDSAKGKVGRKRGPYPLLIPENGLGGRKSGTVHPVRQFLLP
jgi:hypothetical protein